MRDARTAQIPDAGIEDQVCADARLVRTSEAGLASRSRPRSMRPLNFPFSQPGATLTLPAHLVGVENILQTGERSEG